MNTNRKIILMICLTTIAVVIAIIDGTEKEKLPIGSQLPVLKYWSEHSSGIITQNGRTLTIMFFKPDCPHCEYELNTMNNKIDELKTSDFYCVTTDTDFIKNRSYEKWSTLSKHDNFVFASVTENDFNENVGIKMVPLFFTYNTNGKLVDKILGETKFDRLKESIKKAGGAQHQ